MSVANGLKKIASEFNVGLRMYKYNIGRKPPCSAVALDILKHKDVQERCSKKQKHIQSPKFFSICGNKTEKFCFSFPQLDVGIKKNIIEPQIIKISFELPVNRSTGTALELPFNTEKEIKEPSTGRTISKRATHMTIIRRRKMKKHKHKKYLKKHKTEISKKKLKRKMEKEDAFQTMLQGIYREVECFTAEKYVTDSLEKVHWQRPVTRVKGILAPKWVIKEHLKRKEESRNMWKRINECLK